MKKHLALVLVLFLLVNGLFAQSQNGLINPNSTKSHVFNKSLFSLSSNFGFFDRLSFGAGFDLNEQSKLELKYTSFNSGASSQGSLGIKFYRLFDSKIIQSVAIEAGMFDAFKSESYDRLNENVNLQLMVGKNLSERKNITFKIEAGALFINPFNYNKEVYPNIRIGAVYTFDKNTFSQIEEDIKTNSEAIDASEIQEEKISRVFARLNFGIADLLAFNLGYNFNKKNALSLLLSTVWLKGGFFVPNSGSGVGLKYTYSFNSKLFLKNVSVSSLLLTNTSEAGASSNLFKGGMVELTMGNQKDFDGGFSFIYELGVMATKSSISKILVMPSIKIGTNFNF